MKSQLVDRLVHSVLYEEYMLYPHRSAVKNRLRRNHGVVYPLGMESSHMVTECLVVGHAETFVHIEVRFLQLHDRNGWHEPEERRIGQSTKVADQPRSHFEFGSVSGTVDVSVAKTLDSVFKIRVQVSNGSAVKHGENPLLRSLVSTHTVLNVQDGEFISLHAPPERFADAAAACLNVGTWPVLIGEEPERDCMLSCPVILYDYPQVAAEPACDLFDGRRELRSGFSRGDRVRLNPKAGGKDFDLQLAGRIAIVESVEQDSDNRTHLAVVIQDDPGKGSRFFFSESEVELLQ